MYKGDGISGWGNRGFVKSKKKQKQKTKQNKKKLAPH